MRILRLIRSVTVVAHSTLFTCLASNVVAQEWSPRLAEDLRSAARDEHVTAAQIADSLVGRLGLTPIKDEYLRIWTKKDILIAVSLEGDSADIAALAVLELISAEATLTHRQISVCVRVVSGEEPDTVSQPNLPWGKCELAITADAEFFLEVGQEPSSHRYIQELASSSNLKPFWLDAQKSFARPNTQYCRAALHAPEESDGIQQAAIAIKLSPEDARGSYLRECQSTASMTFWGMWPMIVTSDGQQRYSFSQLTIAYNPVLSYGLKRNEILKIFEQSLEKFPP